VARRSSSFVRHPTNPDATIWRFIDLPKFLDFLYTGSLYFSRLDRLGDPYEGLPSKEQFDSLRKDPSIEWMARVIHDSNHYNTFVNSWHLSEHEPAAMWKLYAGVDAGVAICSTYARLRRSVQSSAHGVQVSLIHYGDPPSSNVVMWEYALWKRKSFEHEHEVRAIIPPTGFSLGSKTNAAGEHRPDVSRQARVGIHVPVDMNQLVTAILLSPTTPHWVLDAIASVTRKFRLKMRIRQSDLYTLDYDES